MALAPEQEGRQMEEMQNRLDQTRAEFHKAVEAKNKAQQDAAWAEYMKVLFQAQDYNKINGTQLRHTL